VLAVAGADARRALAPEASYADFAPDVSPDGLRVALIREGITAQHLVRAPSLYVVNANGGGVVAITRGSALSTSNAEVGHYDAVTGVSWSPDGRRLVYAHEYVGSRYEPSRSELVVANVDGTNPRTIFSTVSPEAPAESPSWGAARNEIVFARQPSLWLVKPDGSGLAEVIPASEPVKGEPVWSPDGGKIVYAAGGGIDVINADGSSPTTLLGGKLNAASPAWSPNGSTIAFSADYGRATFDIYAMNADGGDVRRLTTNGADDVTPTWTPGGQILFASTRGRGRESSDLWLMNADGSNQHRLVRRTPKHAANGRRCTIVGTVATDELAGSAAADVLCAFGGSDRVSGGSRGDVVDGGPGKDALDAGTGNDLILARDGRKDIVRGGPGFDRARVDRGDTVSGVERLLP
jgi:TolB protein